MKDTCKIEFDVGQTQFIDTGVKDYNKLTNKPSINDITLEGNKTLKELGIQPECMFEIAYGNLNSQANLEALTKASQLEKKGQKFYIYLNKNGLLYGLSSYKRNSTTQMTLNFELDIASDTKDTKEISKKEVISLYAINQLGYDNVISISEARSKKELYGYKNKDDMVFKTDIPSVEGFIDKDVDDLTNYTNNTDLEATYAKKADISKVYKSKGSVDTYAELANKEATAQVGDVYDVKETGKNYVWTEEGNWDDLGGIVDLSNYVEKVIEANKGQSIIQNTNTGGQLLYLTKDNKRANVSVNDGEAGIYVQLSTTDTETGEGTRVTLGDNKAYYTSGNTYEFTDKDEIINKKALEHETQDLLQGLSRKLIPDEEEPESGFSSQTLVEVKNKSGGTETIMEIDNLDIKTSVSVNQVLGALKGQDLENRLKEIEEGGTGGLELEIVASEDEITDPKKMYLIPYDNTGGLTLTMVSEGQDVSGEALNYSLSPESDYFTNDTIEALKELEGTQVSDNGYTYHYEETMEDYYPVFNLYMQKGDKKTLFIKLNDYSNSQQWSPNYISAIPMPLDFGKINLANTLKLSTIVGVKTEWSNTIYTFFGKSIYNKYILAGVRKEALFDDTLYMRTTGNQTEVYTRFQFKNPLTLEGDITDELNIVNKKYVDDLVKNAIPTIEFEASMTSEDKATHNYPQLDLNQDQINTILNNNVSILKVKYNIEVDTGTETDTMVFYTTIDDIETSRSGATAKNVKINAIRTNDEADIIYHGELLGSGDTFVSNLPLTAQYIEHIKLDDVKALITGALQESY